MTAPLFSNDGLEIKESGHAIHVDRHALAVLSEKSPSAGGVGRNGRRILAIDTLSFDLDTSVNEIQCRLLFQHFMFAERSSGKRLEVNTFELLKNTTCSSFGHLAGMFGDYVYCLEQSFVCSCILHNLLEFIYKLITYLFGAASTKRSPSRSGCFSLSSCNNWGK